MASMTVRRSCPMLAMVLLALAACASPQGVPVPECASDFAPVFQATPRAMTSRPESLPIACYRVTGTSRLEAGFLMPPGPDCFAVESVEVVESAESVSLELRVGGIIDPLGACPEEELPWSVLVELNGPVEGREILDAVGDAG